MTAASDRSAAQPATRLLSLAVLIVIALVFPYLIRALITP